MKLPFINAGTAGTIKPGEITLKDIHNDFDSASERLLENAKQVLAKAIDEKGERLAKLGFKNTSEAIDASLAKTAREMAQAEAERVRYFGEKYPTKKFISRSEAQRVAKKYGLVIGTVDRFIGHVPEANLREIESFTLAPEDRRYVRTELGVWVTECSNQQREEDRYREHLYSPVPLSIIANFADFDMKNAYVKDNTIFSMPKDPIVLQPVEGGYLILTAWGDEANDPAVKRA